MELSGFADTEFDSFVLEHQISSPAERSIHLLKSNQLSALESLATLLLREVELLKKAEDNAIRNINNDQGISLHEQVQNFEISMIRSALIRAKGVQKKAAELLGLKVSTLNVKIKRYKITFTPPEES